MGGEVQVSTSPAARLDAVPTSMPTMFTLSPSLATVEATTRYRLPVVLLVSSRLSG